MKPLLASASCWVWAVLAAAAADRPLTLKMATLVPKESSWHAPLRQMAERWNMESGGRVVLRLYSGGTAGTEADVARRMGLGTLDAGLLTIGGLARTDGSVWALGIPMAYSSYDEAYFVLEKVRPRIERALDAKGLVVLSWADAGWVRFFTRKPVSTPDDLRALKLFTTSDDVQWREAWQSAGFQPVLMPDDRLKAALDVGSVAAFGSPPQVAMVTRSYTHARNMTDLSWHLLFGAIAVNKATWERIPPDIRPRLLLAARDAGHRLQDETRRHGETDVLSMRKRGLTVIAPDARARTLWQRVADDLHPKIRGTIVPADVFDEALRQRDEYRRHAAR